MKQAIHMDPKILSLCYKYGGELYSEAKYTEAALIFRLIINYDSSSYWAYNALGSTLSCQGECTEAISQYNKALEIKEDYELIYINWGLVLFLQGKFCEMENMIEKGVLLLKNKQEKIEGVIKIYKKELESSNNRSKTMDKSQVLAHIQIRAKGIEYILSILRNLLQSKQSSQYSTKKRPKIKTLCYHRFPHPLCLIRDT